MAKYLMLKHYRGAPAPEGFVPMDQWTPAEVNAHIQYMRDFAAKLEQTGEFVDAQGLAPEGTWVQYGGAGRSGGGAEKKSRGISRIRVENPGAAPSQG
jgi:hypothetical protein